MPSDDEPLREEDLDPDPLLQFGRWFDDARTVVAMPEAMALATVDAGGQPSVRMVLLKGWDRRGFLFHTNYDSRKAHDLAAQPRAGLAFSWDPLGRQVRVEGAVVKVTEAESDEYFATRPRPTQIGAYASHQSRPVTDRAELDGRVAAWTEHFDGREVPRPTWWGGYRLLPHLIEFWQHRASRLHDRLVYRPEVGGWRIERLQP